MNYTALKRYLSQQMRLSHIYQPVMLKAIPKSSKPVTVGAVAKQFLEQDLSRVEYYERAAKQMPAKVLKKNGVIKRGCNGLRGGSKLA